MFQCLVGTDSYCRVSVAGNVHADPRFRMQLRPRSRFYGPRNDRSTGGQTAFLTPFSSSLQSVRSSRGRFPAQSTAGRGARPGSEAGEQGRGERPGSKAGAERPGGARPGGRGREGRRGSEAGGSEAGGRGRGERPGREAGGRGRGERRFWRKLRTILETLH